MNLSLKDYTNDNKQHAIYGNIFTPLPLIIFHNTCATLLLIFYLNHFQAWILSHFPRIFGWSYEDDYFEDLPRTCAFVALKGNQTIEPFQVFFECTTSKNIHYTPYDNHQQTIHLDDIALYSR